MLPRGRRDKGDRYARMRLRTMRLPLPEEQRLTKAEQRTLDKARQILARGVVIYGSEAEKIQMLMLREHLTTRRESRRAQCA